MRHGPTAKGNEGVCQRDGTSRRQSGRSPSSAMGSSVSSERRGQVSRHAEPQIRSVGTESAWACEAERNEDAPPVPGAGMVARKLKGRDDSHGVRLQPKRNAIYPEPGWSSVSTRWQFSPDDRQFPDARRCGTSATETGRPLTGAPQLVTSEDLVRFAAVSARYGRWNTTPKRTGGGQARFVLLPRME